MNTASRHLARKLLTALLLLAANGAYAAPHHTYIPFSLVLNSGTQNQGMWLADTDHLGNPPYQLTNQVLDGPYLSNVAILDDWRYSRRRHEAVNVQPQLVVYGVGGHLYKADLHRIMPVAQFSNAGYAELCSLQALDERPFSPNRAYIQAVVVPAGSTGSCASGASTQTWLIPANADNTVAPMIESQYWTVLGAFTDPNDGRFVNWIVWTGSEVDAFTANFSSQTSLLVGLPTGSAPAVAGRLDSTSFLLFSSDSAGTHTDTLYRVSLNGSGLVASYSYADTAPCVTIGIAQSSIVDSDNGVLAFAEPSNSGYAVFTAPLAGGAPTQIYADNSGNECGTIAGDSVSVNHVGLDEVDLSSGFQHVIAVSESGPVNQAPVFLAGGNNLFAYIRYTINGHFWIPVKTDTTPTQFTTLVADGDGTVVQTYANASMGDDIWNGFFPAGTTPGVERDVVYLFSPADGSSCSGGTLAAINPLSFASTSIAGVPADACSTLAYGWQPASVGYVTEPAGSSPIEIDPVAGQLYLLRGPDSNGLFENLAQLPGYPFY